MNMKEDRENQEVLEPLGLVCGLRMKTTMLQPNVVSQNAALTACEKGQRPSPSEHLKDENQLVGFRFFCRLKNCI